MTTYIPTARLASNNASQPDKSSYFVLGVALLLIILGAVQVLYRISLPSEGWMLAFNMSGNDELLIFERNLSNHPSPLRGGDVLVAVEGQAVPDMNARASRLVPQRPGQWQVGNVVHYTVNRDGKELILPVRLTTRSTVRVLQNIGSAFLLNPIILPALLLGCLVFWRRPSHRGARLLFLFSVAIFVADGMSGAVTGVKMGPAEFFYRGAYWPAQFCNKWIWAFLIGPIYIHLFLVFPVVKEPMRSHPWLTKVVLYGYMPALLLLNLWRSGGDWVRFWHTWPRIIAMDYFIVVAAVALSIGHTFLKARKLEHRLQIRWVAWGIFLMSAGLIIGFLLDLLGLISKYPWLGFATYRLPMLAFPASLTIAILRYNLFNIDTLINRTLVYSVLTASLALAYLAAVTTLQTIASTFTTNTSTWTVVGSTLLLVILLHPLRQRSQDFIDRSFYRRKYNAQKTLAAFGTTLRTERSLDELADELTRVIEETMQPEQVFIWLTPVPKETGVK